MSKLDIYKGSTTIKKKTSNKKPSFFKPAIRTTGMVRFGRVLALSVSVIASVCLFWPHEKFQWNLPSLASVNGSSLLRGPSDFVENASGENGEILNSQSETSYFSTTELKMLSTELQEFGTSRLPEQMVVTSTDFQLDLPALPENLQGYCRCVQQGGHQPVGSTWYAEEEMKSLLSEMRDNLKIYLYPIKHHCKVSWAKYGQFNGRAKTCCKENTCI